jgi:hypothetical protein
VSTEYNQSLKEHFGGVEMPGSSGELQVLIDTAYEEVTGRSLADPSTFVVDQFRHGGMSRCDLSVGCPHKPSYSLGNR